jgi:hypothetical protein
MAAAAWTACTKKLFLQKKVGPRSESNCSGVSLFYGHFLGCFGKRDVQRAVFGGEFVVFCMVDVVV